MIRVDIRPHIEPGARDLQVALGDVQLDPDIRKSGDMGNPAVLAGEDSPSAKSLYQFARKVIARVEEIKASAPESVIQIQ